MNSDHCLLFAKFLYMDSFKIAFFLYFHALPAVDQIGSFKGRLTL